MVSKTPLEEKVIKVMIFNCSQALGHPLDTFRNPRFFNMFRNGSKKAFRKLRNNLQKIACSEGGNDDVSWRVKVFDFYWCRRSKG